MSTQQQKAVSQETESNKSLFWYRVRFLALISVFLSPFIAGWLALYVFEIRPESNNYGTLVQPVKKLSWSQFTSTSGKFYENGFGKKWVSIIFNEGKCEKQCRDNIFNMRQIRILLGRDTDRLQNVLITRSVLDNEMISFLEDFKNLIVIENFTNSEFTEQFRILESGQPGQEPMVYLIDPENNYMMFFPTVFDEYRVLDDIKRLLKLSQIG